MAAYGTINNVNSHVHSSGTFFSKFEGSRIVCFTAMSAFMYIVNFGFSTSYTSQAGVDMMKSESRVVATPEDVSWIASIGAISSMIGGICAGYLSNKLGRKALLMYTSFPLLSSWLMVAYGTNMTWIYTGRFLTGFCCGLIAVVVPTYVVEISTPSIRGFLGAWFNVAFAFGILLTNCLGTALTWSWLATCGGILATLSALIFVFMPESPHWLLANDQRVQAFEALLFLRGNCDKATKEYEILSKILREEEENKSGIAYKAFLQPVLYKPTVLCVGLMFFQQFCGVNALISYTVEIFRRAETTLDPSVATIVVSVMQLLTTLISSMLMDKAGRRMLFIVSGGFASVGLTVLGVFGRLTSTGVISHAQYGWIPVLGFIVFVMAFNLGYGPVPWVMAPEMVPTHARSTVVGISTVATGLFMFIVVKSFDVMRDALNDYGVYLLYALISLLGCFFCYFLPETKGKTLDEIQSYFRGQISLKNIP